MAAVQKLDASRPLDQNELREISLPEVKRTLYARRKTIFAIVLSVLALGIVLCLVPRRYTATGTIWVEPGESNVYRMSPSLSNMIGGAGDDIVASEVKVLQSRTLYLRVAGDLDLANDPQFWGLHLLRSARPQQKRLSDPKIADMVYRRMMHVVKLGHDPKDEIIDISVTTHSPELSAKIVNTLVNDYVAYLFEIRYGATKRASGWLVDQLGSLKKKIESDQAELTSLQGRLGIVGFDEKNTADLYAGSLGELMKASDAATIDRIVAEAKLRYLQESNPNLIEGEINLLPEPSRPSSPSQSLLGNLRTQQAQASSNYARLLNQYGDNFPEVKQQKAQLDEINNEVKAEEQRIINQAKLSYDAASANEKMAGDVVQREKAKVFSSHDEMVQFVLLLHDYQADRELYEGLIQHLQEAGITSGLEAGDINVVDLADVPAVPDAPGPVLIIGASIVGGLILGIFVALWLASMDQRISRGEQIEAIAGLPVLGQVPHFKFEQNVTESPGGRRLVIAKRSHYSEAMQSLRASLLLSRPGEAPRVILVTSATANEGKSTTVINLAAAFARHGKRVIVIDCDLRKGSLARKLYISSQSGLTNVLTRQVPFESAMQNIPEAPGLFVLVEGPQPPDPAVLVGSEEMRILVDRCKEQFDLVLLDSPPVLGIADGLHLGRLADSVLVVVRENVSNRKAVQEAVTLLLASHIPVIGCVLNDVDPRAAAYGYGYAYRDYYAGYYADTEDA